MINQYDLMGNIDFVLLGMLEERHSAAKDYQEKQDTFARNLLKDLRTVYDAYMPNIHIVDADNVATLVVDGVIDDFTSILSYNGDPETAEIIKAALIKAAPALRKDIRDGIAVLHNKFKARSTGQTNPIAHLNSALAKHLEAVEGSVSPETAQNIGKAFAAEITKTFPKNTALLGVDAAAVGIESKPNRYVFFQKSFVSGKDTINRNITSILRESLLKIKSIALYSDVKAAGSITGNYVDFGHIGTRESGSQDLNINTPALAKILYNVINLDAQVLHVGRKDPTQAKSLFVQKTGHIAQSITVTKEFTANASVLLSIGVTQTTDMSSDLNRHILGPKEARQLDRAVRDRFNSNELMVRALRDRLAQSFLGPSIDKLLEGRSSYSVIDFIETAIVRAIRGDAAPSLNQTKSRTKRSEVKYLEMVAPSFLSGPIKSAVARVAKPKARPSTAPKTQASESSLESLMAYINTHLQNVISSKMGDGSAKNILNYRTGRFAGSAKVTRMTKSREGMITAFYDYMKNPYATFSTGGAQQYPKTRDPKLLISSSIREIAAQKVKDRLRAVVV